MNGWNDWIYFWAMATCGGVAAFPFRMTSDDRLWPVATMFLGLGVYLAGGIAPRLVKVLQQGGFRAAFEDKYPHQALMASLPTAIIVHDRPALAGLVDFARRPDTFGLRLDGRHWRA